MNLWIDGSGPHRRDAQIDTTAESKTGVQKTFTRRIVDSLILLLIKQAVKCVFFLFCFFNAKHSG